MWNPTGQEFIIRKPKGAPSQRQDRAGSHGLVQPGPHTLTVASLHFPKVKWMRFKSHITPHNLCGLPNPQFPHLVLMYKSKNINIPSLCGIVPTHSMPLCLLLYLEYI